MVGRDDFDKPNRPVLDQAWAALAFLTHLPHSADGRIGHRSEVVDAAWAFPIAGAAIGLGGGIAFVVANGLGLPSLLSASLAALAVMAASGARAEQGLAATADAFARGGGATATLAAMRETRLGVVGMLAVLFAVLIRVAALQGLAIYGGTSVVLILIAAETAAATAMVKLWHDLPAARRDGPAARAETPGDRDHLNALLIAAAIVFIAAMAAAGLVAGLLAAAGTAAATLAFIRLCRSHIGGHSGEALGAVAALTPVVFLLLILVFL